MPPPGTGTRTTPSSKDDKIARGDRKFIEEAAASGMFEVQVAQLAATRATDQKLPTLQQHLAQAKTLPQSGQSGSDANRMGNTGQRTTGGGAGEPLSGSSTR